jgi:hypothetical protein
MSNNNLDHEAVVKISLGLAAGSFAGILSLLQVPKLDTYLIIFLFCFSMLLPPNLIIGALSNSSSSKEFAEKYPKYAKFAALSLIGSLTIAFVAIFCLISHFSLYIGITVACFSVIYLFILPFKIAR